MLHVTSPDLELSEALENKNVKLETSSAKVSMGVQTSRMKLPA